MQNVDVEGKAIDKLFKDRARFWLSIWVVREDVDIGRDITS